MPAGPPPTTQQRILTYCSFELGDSFEHFAQQVVTLAGTFAYA